MLGTMVYHGIPWLFLEFQDDKKLGVSAGLTTNPKVEFYLWAVGMLIPNHCVLFVLSG